jgi:hypothetical protein
MAINYTTYDVRRAEDIINPTTSRCDIMLLSDNHGESANHQYAYARILGVYHANVIYGPTDYRARRMEFLWVRWFINMRDEPVEESWSRQQLDCVQFLPLHHEDAFGFVDPSQVLRGVHVIPYFAKGLRYKDGKGVSRFAKDADDWNQYCVNR